MQQRITAQEADTGTTDFQEQQEATIIPADSRGKGITTADVPPEAQTEQGGSLKALTEVPVRWADTADAPVTTSNPTRPIAPGSTIASSSEQVSVYEPIMNQPITQLNGLAPKLTPTSLQNFNISDLLSFDPALMGLTAPRAEASSSHQPIIIADQLQNIKGLLSAPISTLVDNSSEIKSTLEQVESQLPESLQVKLWPAGHLPFFRAEVKAAQQRIDARHSQASLKADIAQRCRTLNQKKATLDAKADISANITQLNLLEKELAGLEEKVRITQKLIQEEKASIANSKQEAQEMTEQIRAEFAEISTLSRQIVTGDDKDDEAIIA